MGTGNEHSVPQSGETRAEAPVARRTRWIDVLIAIAVLGSVWGFAEVVLGGAIKAAGFPQRAAVMTGLGMGIMAVALGAFKRPLMLLGIAALAILCKELVVPILHVSILCKANSCLAVAIDGVALAGVAGIAGRKLTRSYAIQVVAAASAALLARSAFYFGGMKLAPCAHLLSFDKAGGYASFMGYNALGWVVSSALFFPLGYWLGMRLREPVLAMGLRKPGLYYTTSAASVALCWAASALAISAGF